MHNFSCNMSQKGGALLMWCNILKWKMCPLGVLSVLWDNDSINCIFFFSGNSSLTALKCKGFTEIKEEIWEEKPRPSCLHCLSLEATVTCVYLLGWETSVCSGWLVRVCHWSQFSPQKLTSEGVDDRITVSLNAVNCKCCLERTDYLMSFTKLSHIRAL